KLLIGNDQEISNFDFPNEFQPGNDSINKIILTDERVINIITNSVINAPEKSYVTAPTEFINKHICNVLYTPHDTQNTLPPILINIVENLEKTELNQIIQLCIGTYEKYDTLPVCLIIVTHQFNENITEQSSPCQKLPFLREISSTFWAKQCLLTSSK
ncbi:MAG: hypothetical protein EXX96DRAFT_498097, partial [Benjaminiella poitrasii]